MRKRFVLCVALAALWNTAAAADTLKPDYPICVSEDLLGQMYNAILNRDMNSMDYLLDHGCFQTKAGVRVSILSQSYGAARVRVYAGKEAVEAWTSVAAVDSSRPDLSAAP
jgi:hypothetical protein